MGLVGKPWAATYLLNGGRAPVGGSQRLDVLLVRLAVLVSSLHSLAAGKPSPDPQSHSTSSLDVGISSRPDQATLLVQLFVVVASAFGLQRQFV